MVIKVGKTGLTLGHVVRGEQVRRGQGQPFQPAETGTPERGLQGLLTQCWLILASLEHLLFQFFFLVTMNILILFTSDVSIQD